MVGQLADDERQALVSLLTLEIEASKFPLSPRIEMLKRIRAKLAARCQRPRRPRVKSLDRAPMEPSGSVRVHYGCGGAVRRWLSQGRLGAAQARSACSVSRAVGFPRLSRRLAHCANRPSMIFENVYYRSWLRRSSPLALSENDVPFDPYSVRTLDPDFGWVLFEDGTREVYSGGGDGEGRRGLKNAALPAQSPSNDVRHNFHPNSPAHVVR